MNKSEIHVSLDSMLTNHKAKNFLNHLVRAYVPSTKVEKVWEKPKNEFKCVFTRKPLISIQEILQEMDTEDYKKNFMGHLKTMFQEDSKVENPLSKLIGDRTLGLTGKDTTTFMSFNAYQEFVTWLMTKTLEGDKHINWLINSVRGGNFDKKINKPKQQQVKQSTYSMGEASDVLAKLKSEMDNSEKKK